MEHAEHEARPELRHHFADVEQQRNAATLGMWWFLGTEIMFFGGMFCAYLIYRRWYFPEFAAASRSLSLPIGTFNTTVLICSSLTVAMSVRAARLGRERPGKAAGSRGRHPAAHESVLFSLFRTDWHARNPHDHRRGHIRRRDLDGAQGALYAGVSHTP